MIKKSNKNRLLTLASSGLFLTALTAVSQPALAQSCDVVPTHIHVIYNFGWDEAQQSALAGVIETGCRTPAMLNRLSDDVGRELLSQDIPLRQVQILPEQNPSIITIRLTTAKDSSDQDFSSLLPLAQPKGEVITSLEVVGEAQEDIELIARYSINETNYSKNGGRLEMRWLRDGVLIAGENKSRYRLRREDVGASIAAQLVYVGGKPGSQDARIAALSQQVLAANYPPEILDLQIVGVAETGETLTARYQFKDENEGDLEAGTSFIWLRDNLVIEGADGPQYETGAADIGAQISVRVVPQSADGQTGAARSATLADNIAAKPVIASQEVVDNIAKKDADSTFDSAALEEAITTAQKDSQLEDVVPVPRPDIPSDDAAAKAAEALADKVGEVVADADRAEADKEDDAPAIIITEEDVADVASVEDEVAPADIMMPATALTEGFFIAADSPDVFTGLTFTSTAILPEFQLKRVEKQVLGLPITLEAIKAILDEVNALYLAAGFELSRALLPEQTVTDGMVAIQLVEAKVGKIIVENIRRLDEQFIRDHLAAEEGGYISLAQLERSIRTYNLSNKSNLATELAPGEEFGETDIFVDVAEPDTIELPTVSVDNYANKTSDWRNNAISLTINNTFGIDDETALSYSDAKGSTSQSFSFSAPLDRAGSNLSLSLTNSDTKIVAGSEETVGYRGSATSMSASYSTPILFGDEYSVYLSTTYGASKSDLVQPVTGLMLTKSHMRKFSLSTPYNYNNGTTSFSIAPAWHVINMVTEIPLREKWVQKFDATATVSQYLNEKWTANVRSQILYTNARDMINMPSEILSVGGPSSVRAYQPAESSGYQGYFVSGELRTDLANWEEVPLPDFMPSAQLYVFADHMMAQTQYKVRSRGDYWSGYGVGLQIPSIFNLLTFDVYWAEPLDGEIHEDEKEFYDDELFQFSLSARFRLQ